MSEPKNKTKAKVTLTARIKRAGSDEWEDLGQLSRSETVVERPPRIEDKKDG